MSTAKEYRNINFRMEKTLKDQLEAIFDDMGMNMTTAFTVFAKAVIKTGKIPFEITSDPFYKAEHQNELKRRIESYNETGGADFITMSIDDLEAIVNG